MAKAELKTKQTDRSVERFLNSIPDEKMRRDCFTIMNLMKEITGSEPKMWGDSIIGFGTYHYVYESGREGDWFLTGFSPRKQNLTLYIMSGFEEYDVLMKNLGTYKTGKSCLYIKMLENIQMTILRKLIKKSIDHLRKKYG
jgi:hypothetical protein